MSKYDLAAIRQRLAAQSSAKNPNEWRCPKAAKDQILKYRYFVLPPVMAGDVVAGGTATRDMSNYFVKDGGHFFNKKRIACPRIINDVDCEICSIGFDLLAEIDPKDKPTRSKISKKFLSTAYYKSNIYFPPVTPNPEDLHGAVKVYAQPKTVYDICNDCINRDDYGDDQERLAFGVFYDEEAAYLLQLEVIEKGGWNNYEKSKFLVPATGPMPIAKDAAKRQLILAQRHDIWASVEEPDMEAIARLAKELLNDTGSTTTISVGSGSSSNGERERTIVVNEQGEPQDQGETAAEMAARQTRKAITEPPKKGIRPAVEKPAAAAAPEAASEPEAPTPSQEELGEADDPSLDSLLAELN